MSSDPDPIVDEPLTVIANDETSDGVDDVDRWVEVARSTLEGEAIRAGRLDLIFVDEEAIAALNREHLGGDGPTDVLAFPLDGPDEADPARGTPVHLGDVVVCPAVAGKQAPAHCGSYDAEMTLLIVHGVLHVLGHDHAQPGETAEMQARERHHLQRDGIVHPVPTASEGLAAVTSSGADGPKNRA